MSRLEILAEVDAERQHQEQRWGNDADDTKNAPNDFVAYIAHYSTKWFSGGFSPYNSMSVAAFRKNMVRVAAIAVAAIESLDRQIAANGKPFYQG